MTTLIKSKPYFTHSFASLQPTRKVEVIMAELYRLAQYADCDTDSVLLAINSLDELRQNLVK